MQPSKQTARARPTTAAWIAPLALVAATIAVYWGVWRFEFVNFDDAIALSGDASAVLDDDGGVHLPDRGLAAILEFERGREYLPVRDASYAIDRTLFGGARPGGFHLTNLVIHIVSGLVFVRLAAALGVAAPASFLAGALFLLHPIQTESIAWIAGRKDLLAAAFALASWLAYARERRAASAALFLAAALSKATVVALPLAFITADLANAASRRANSRISIRAAVARAAPHLAISTLVAAIALATSRGAGMLRSGGDRGAIESLLLACKLPFLYAANIAWPARLHLLYSPALPSPGDPASWLAPLALLAVIALMVAIARTRPLAAAGAAAFLLLLLPTLGLVPFQILMADRYAYLPLAGVALAAAALWPARWSAERARVPVAIAACALVAVLAPAARREASAWRNSETLWTREIARDANHADAWMNLGTHYLSQSRARAARGDTLASRDRARLAAEKLERAAHLNPSAVGTRVNWALAAALAGDHVTALRAIELATSLEPRNPLVLYNSACVRARVGDIDGAIGDLARAIDCGFAEKERLESDPDLEPLRADARFQNLKLR
ncbi:MAG: tetratricopeptide repeat protein [bacterium]